MSGPFDIVIRYSGDTLYQSAFDAAAARWEQIITADIPDIVSPTWGAIDDLLIDASVLAIDGAGGVLGQAGPDEVRSGSWLPDHGEMEFDSADVAQMYASGTLTNVILHELGHILGIGTLWDVLGLRSGSSYTGAYALAEYRSLTGNASASSVPLETGGGAGTAGSHWSEAVFDRELMTGYAEIGAMPLSRLTIAALQDIGYAVNYAAADAYAISSNIGMRLVSFHAVDSVSGDYFNGIVYDNTGRYHVGDTVAFANNRGGSWTYSIAASSTADTAHQNSFYAGKVYDTYYYDADRGVGAITTYGFQGYNYGTAADTTNFSGANYLGSDGDYVVLGGATQRFAYNYVIPDQALMRVAYFRAVDSVSGDYFNGMVYDNTGRYHVGDTQSFANNRGGNWTYSIQVVATADSAHQNASYTGKVYDTFYYDADLGVGHVTNSGFLGYNYGTAADTTSYSGANYLGSDGDYVVLNGATQRFAYNYVVPDHAVMRVAYFRAVDSATGDYFNGIVYDNTGRYHVGDTQSFANDRGGNWTYSIQVLATADSAHQISSYSGIVYDTFYFDASLGVGHSTNSGFQGYNYGAPIDTTHYSGVNYLGSDGDYVVLNGITQRFAFNHPVAGLTAVADQGVQTGADVLVASAASDTFIFAPATGEATMQPFNPAQDQIAMNDSGSHGLNEVPAHPADDAGSSAVHLGLNDPVALPDAHGIALAGHNFIFV